VKLDDDKLFQVGLSETESYESTFGAEKPVIMVSGGEPWFSAWNYRALEYLFKVLPHTSPGLSLASFLLENPLFTTWVYAAVSYAYWSKRDERQEQRRIQLLRVVAACVLAVVVAWLLDLGMGWPSPARTPGFQQLFPRYLWGVGTTNSFPSHSTLAYLTVAVGLLRVSRMAGLILIPFTFLVISLPRVYLGGHYLIDLCGSIGLSLMALGAVDLLLARGGVERAFKWAATQGVMTEVAFFFWLYELGEGFRGAEDLVHYAPKFSRFW
jgi:membrane-associated phospholipid phosphatase